MNLNEHGSTGVSEIVQELESKANQLVKRHKDLTDQARQTNRELTCLRGAIRALSGTAGASKTGSRPKAFSTREVVQLIDEVLAAAGSLEMEDLQKHVESKARTLNRPLTGFHLRFNKATEDSKFLVTDGPVDCVVSRRSVGSEGLKK